LYLFKAANVHNHWGYFTQKNRFYELGNKDEYPIKNNSLKRVFYVYR